MKHLVESVQSVLISKSKFPTASEAIAEAQKLGYNAHFKLQPHETGHFWRFRQHNPMESARYITKKLDHGNKLVVDLIDKDSQGHDYQRLKQTGMGNHHLQKQTRGADIVKDKYAVNIPNYIQMDGFKIDMNKKKLHKQNQF